jgi:hypothetical protein
VFDVLLKYCVDKEHKVCDSRDFVCGVYLERKVALSFTQRPLSLINETFVSRVKISLADPGLCLLKKNSYQKSFAILCEASACFAFQYYFKVRFVVKTKKAPIQDASYQSLNRIRLLRSQYRNIPGNQTERVP